MSQCKAYPKYKDSGIEWIGQVPEHWQIAPVKAISTTLNGATPESAKAEYWDGDIVWYTPTDIDNEAAKELGVPRRYISQAGFDNCAVRLAPPGSVVLSTRAPIGSVGITLVPSTTNQGCRTLVPTQSLPGKLLAFVLIAARDELRLRGNGTTFQELSTDSLRSMRIPLPPPNERNQIADHINHESDRIDALIRKKTRFIDLLKEKRQALITHAVTKGLDPNVKMKDSGIEWIGQVPEEWLNRKVFHAFQTIGSGTTPPSKEHEWYQGGTIPWITTSELRENTVVKTKKCVTSDAMQKFSALKIFPAGSLAIAMYGATIGRLGFLGIPATTNQACCVLSGERDLNIQFLYYWLMVFRDYIVAFFSEGGGQPNINQEVIASLRVPSPAPDEQANIVATLDRETARIDTLVEKTKQSITLLKERRAAFITAAVTGQIDLRGEH